MSDATPSEPTEQPQTPVEIIDARIEHLRTQQEQLAQLARNMEVQLGHAQKGLVEIAAQMGELKRVRKMMLPEAAAPEAAPEAP